MEIYHSGRRKSPSSCGKALQSRLSAGKLWEVNGNDSPPTKTTKKTRSLAQREEDRDGCTGKGFDVLLSGNVGEHGLKKNKWSDFYVKENL